MIEKKTEQEIFQELQLVLKNINENYDISSSSIDYSANQQFAGILADAYEYTQQAIQAVDPDSANMQQLKNIFYMLGLPILAAVKSTATLTITGIMDSIIPVGSQFKDTDDNIWVSTEQVSIDGTEKTYLPVECQTAGAITADIESINTIVIPIEGIASVTNESVAAVGRNTETLKELKARYKKTLYRNSENTIYALESALYEISGVTSVSVIANRSDNFLNIKENTESETDENYCIAPRSTIIYVDGGDEDEIIKKIADKYSIAEHLNQGRDAVLLGTEVTKTYATPERNVIINGSERIIGGNSKSDVTFYRPSHQYISIKFTIVPKIGQTIPDNYPDLIKQAIIDFATGNLFDDDNVEGYDKTGYQIGERVTNGDLSTPINKILGKKAYFKRLFVSNNNGNNWYSHSITVYNGQIGRFDKDRIFITQEQEQ